MNSGPKAVRFPNGTLQVFARGSDRKFYQSTMTADYEWSDWASLGETAFLSPPEAVVTSAGSVLVFGVASNHNVSYSESTPISSGELTFSLFADLGQTATSSVKVLVDSEALVHVFVRGTNRAMWHISEEYTHPGLKQWQPEWECLGGVMASSPSVPVSLNGVGLVEAYGRAADKALWHRPQTAQQAGTSIDWAPWSSLGGVLASGPAVAVNDDGMADVFARATDKAIYFKSQFEDEAGVVHHTPWHTLGGMFSTTPTVVVRADGLFDLFARGVDKAIWHSHQVETNGTRTFSAWHSIGGHTRKYTC